MNKLLIGRDQNGTVIYSIPFADIGYYTTLAAGTAQSLPIPGNAQMAFFSYSSGADVFVDPENTATVPSGSFASTTAELNPVARPVTGGGTLSFVSPAICYVKVSFYTVHTTGVL